MLHRAVAYGQKLFGLDPQLDGVADDRTKPQIPALVFARAVRMLWLCRVPGSRALQAVGRLGVGRQLPRHRIPGADQPANFTEILDALSDGHAINADYWRCCPACQKWQITVNGQNRTQYYHRVVVLMLVGPKFHFLLALERLRSHNDEGTAALQLFKLVLKSCPRSFNILLGDGRYPPERHPATLSTAARPTAAVGTSSTSSPGPRSK